MKEEILELAEKQMMAGGYENLSFSTIAKELNTTRANLHYHFKNKESLAHEVAQRYGLIQYEQMQNLAKQFKGDFFGFIKAAEDFFWAKASNFGSTGICVCTSMAQEPNIPSELKNVSCSFYRHFESLFADVIQEAIENGEIRKDLDPLRESRRSHLIVLGSMTAGQHIGAVDQAKVELGGMLMDWAKGLK